MVVSIMLCASVVCERQCFPCGGDEDQEVPLQRMDSPELSALAKLRESLEYCVFQPLVHAYMLTRNC